MSYGNGFKRTDVEDIEPGSIRLIFKTILLLRGSAKRTTGPSPDTHLDDADQEERQA